MLAKNRASCAQWPPEPGLGPQEPTPRSVQPRARVDIDVAEARVAQASRDERVGHLEDEALVDGEREPVPA